MSLSQDYLLQFQKCQPDKLQQLNLLHLPTSAAPHQPWETGIQVSHVAREQQPPKMKTFFPASLLAGFYVQNYFILYLDKHMSHANKEV